MDQHELDKTHSIASVPVLIRVIALNDTLGNVSALLDHKLLVWVGKVSGSNPAEQHACIGLARTEEQLLMERSRGRITEWSVEMRANDLPAHGRFPFAYDTENLASAHRSSVTKPFLRVEVLHESL